MVLFDKTMAARSKPATAANPPSCVIELYNQDVAGRGLDGKTKVPISATPVRLRFGGIELEFHRSYEQIDARNRGMLRFLACKGSGGPARADAHRAWAALRKLAPDEELFEKTACELAGGALWPREPPTRLTRNDARALNLRTAKYARNLGAALRSHPSFFRESSASNWPAEDAKRIASVLMDWPKDEFQTHRERPHRC